MKLANPSYEKPHMPVDTDPFFFKLTIAFLKIL